MQRALAGCFVLGLLLVTQGQAASPPRIVEQWDAPRPSDLKSGKVLAIAITDDQEIRHHFEDKLVSQLRGRKMPAVTSYSLVPDLLAPGSREEILRRITEQNIDGAVSFRLVRLEGSDEAAWSKEWRHQVESEGTLRSLVEATLPLSKEKSHLYGVEVTLWGRPGEGRIWAGRSGPHKLDELRAGASDFIQDVVGTLRGLNRL